MEGTNSRFELFIDELDSLWLETEKAVPGIAKIDSLLLRKARPIIKINTIYSCILESPSYRCHYDSIGKICESFGADKTTPEGRKADTARRLWCYNYQI